jgi:hypothetical protein
MSEHREVFHGRQGHVDGRDRPDDRDDRGRDDDRPDHDDEGQVGDFELLGPNETVAGRSIAEWTEEWFIWQTQSPTDANPAADPTGAFANNNNDGPVFFIAGTNGGPATRRFEVPEDTPLLIPMLNFFDTLDPKGLERQLIRDFRHGVTDVFAEIDGQAVAHPRSYFLKTDFFSLGPVTSGRVIGDLALAAGVPEGTDLSPTLGAGYWLMIDDLDPGKHTLHFGGSIDSANPVIGQFSTETTVHLRVVEDDEGGEAASNAPASVNGDALFA